MLPVINAFKAAHQLTDVTVVADAGMISEANQVALQAAGLSFILGTRIPYLPDVVREWRDKHPDEAIPDGLVLTQPWPATSSGEGPRHPGPGRSTTSSAMTGPGARCAGSTSRSPKPNVPSTGTPRSNATATSSSPVPPRRSTATLEAKTRALAGWKGYTTNLTAPVRGRSSSTPTTSCGTSRRPSGCPSTTCRPARSTTTYANPSRPT